MSGSNQDVIAQAQQESPIPESPPHHVDITNAPGGLPPGSPPPPQRSPRGKPATDERPRQRPVSWLEADKGPLHKAKGGRLPQRTSPSSTLPKSTSPESSAESTKDTADFFPKLSRILEVKETKSLRRKRPSATPSRNTHTPDRSSNSTTGDTTTLKTPEARPKRGPSQRRVNSLRNLSNPSLVSVLSGSTQVSGISNGSNSTITQQSYNKKLVAKRKPPKKGRRTPVKPEPLTSDAPAMESRQSNVFQYMNESLPMDAFLNGRPQAHRLPDASSSASSSGSESDNQSSDTEDHGSESPMTSPASMRRPDLEVPPDNHDNHDSEDNEDNDVARPVQEPPAAPAYQPSVSDADEDDNELAEEGSSDEGGSEDESESEEENSVSAADSAENQPTYLQNMALEQVPPPRIPSSSSSSSPRHSDRHSRRLRRQEQALNEHVLQSPQPQRDFQFTAGPTTTGAYQAPNCDSYLHSATSPASFYATARYGPVHGPPPPPPTVPPPLPISYHSPPNVPAAPYSPPYNNEFAMTSRPPMPPSAPVQYPPGYLPHNQVHSPGPESSRGMVTGYELLADKLGEGLSENQPASKRDMVVPVYRKFENLNHRILLHLQDEIAELEEELRFMDEYIAQNSLRTEAGHLYPASRRNETRFGNEVYRRRTELLGRIYIKLGQYNSALTSFNNMMKNMDSARTDDIQAYRTWIERHSPIDHAEARFLEHKSDLLAVSQRHRSASIVGGANGRQSAAIWLPIILVLPLMAFAIVPGLAGRLLVLSLIGAAVMKLVTTTEELTEWMTMQEWIRGLSLYFGFMVLLAALAD